MNNPDYFNQIFRISPLPSLILIPHHEAFEIHEANNAWLKVTGFKESDIKGKCFPGILEKFNIPTCTLDAIRHSLKTVLDSAASHKMDGKQNAFSLQNADTLKINYWQPENLPVFKNNNEVEYIIHTLTDITAKILQSKSGGIELKKIMQYSPDIICVIDWDEKLINVSDAVEKIWGYSRDTLIGRKYTDLVAAEDIEKTKTAGAAIMSGVVMSNFENRCIHKNGSLVPMVWSARWDDEDKVMYCVAKDATENKKSELEKSLFIHNTDEAFILLDKELKIVDFNDQAANLYKKYLGRDFLKRDSILSYALPERRETLQKTYEKVLQGIEQIDEIEFPEPQHGSRFYFLKYKPSLNEQGEIIGVFVIAKDVTEIISAKQQVEASEKKYRLLFHKSPIPKWVYDLNTLQILDVNETAITHYGYSRDEFLNMTINDIKPKEDLHKMQAIRENVLKQDGLIHFGIFTQVKKDKSLIKADVTGHKFYFMNRDCMLIESNDVTEKEKALQKLKDNEAKLLSAQKIAKLGYWQKLPHSNNLYWSEEVYNIWGVDKKTFNPDIENFINTIHPDDIEQFNKELDAVFAGEKHHDLEHRIVLPDGSLKWVHEKGKLVKNANGDVVLFEGTVQDITEAKIAREKLLLSEARHRGIVDSQTNYVIRTDLEGKYSYGNNKFIKDFSWIYEGNEIIGKDSLISVNAYHHQRLRDTVEKCFANINTVFQVELDKPRQDGGIITSLWDFICLTDSNGKPTEIQCVGIDISDRKKVEEALKESNARYEYVSKATSDAIWDWDMEKNMIYWGEGLKNIFGHDPRERNTGLISWSDYLHPEDRDKVLRNLAAFIDGKETNWKEEYRYLKADGRYAFVLDKGFVIRDENGKAIKMVGAMQDITDRKTLQDLLSKSNKLARIGSWEIDALKGTVYWSSVTKEIREAGPDFEPDLTMGMHYFKEGKDRDTIRSRVKACIEKGTPWDEELQIVTQKGNLKWIRTIGEAEMVNGKCIKVYGSFQDIDDKKRAELAVLRLYEEKSTILESIGDGFFTIDKKWFITYWNKQAEKLLLKPKNEALGHKLWEVFPESIGSASYINYHKAIETGQVVHFEDHYITLNSWYEISAYPSNNGLSVYFKDITDRKKAEEAIRISNERYTIVSKATNDSIWDWNLITNVVERPSKTLESLFGYEDIGPDDVDDFWKTHVHPEDWKRIAQNRNLLLADPNEDYWEDEYRFLKTDGTYAYIFDRAYIMRDRRGKAIRMIGASNDFTKLKETEIQLKDLNEKLEKRAAELVISNAELEQFAYIASHDLQEPLRMVSSFLTLLEKKYYEALDEKGRQYIHFAVDGAKRMRQIILDLLEYSRVGRAGGMQETVDLNRLVREILVLYRAKIKERKANIKINKLPVLTTSKTPMRQVFQNLISNSLKYANNEKGVAPKITISCKSAKTYWQFSVKDNGIGIDPKDFERIFILFQRLHNKEEYSGTGIGLAITKKIIESMGGIIWLESEKGKGTTFYFTILKNNS